MSITPGDTTPEALMARVAALEQTLASLQLHPSAPIPFTQGNFSSAVATVPAVLATGTNGADGADTSSDSGTGLSTQSSSGVGLHAVGGGANPTSPPDPTAAIFAEAQSAGVYAIGADSGLYGVSEKGTGVVGSSPGATGVLGQSESGIGLYGQSGSSIGGAGQSDSGIGLSGVVGGSVGLPVESGTGLYGQSESGIGLHAVGGGTSPTSSPDPTAAIFAEAQSFGIYATGGYSGILGQSEIGPGASGQGTNGPGEFGGSENSIGVVGVSGSGLAYPTGVSLGIYGQSESGVGLHAVGGGTSPTSSPDLTAAIFGEAQSYGIYAVSDDGPAGVYGQCDNGAGVYGKSENGTGVYGQSGVGTEGTLVGDVGIVGVSANGIGVYGKSDAYIGVVGASDSYVGVSGSSRSSTGVSGSSTSGLGIFGTSETSTGVYGYSDIGLAGEFTGSVDVTDALMKGGGGFQIDHPLEPAHKYLFHSFVESPDMKNIYDGIVTLDANGKAEVMLPSWFGALNSDFRYQLTAIGTAAPGLYISEEISTNHFEIAGGHPGMKVSWQVSGIRQDAWAAAHRIPVEQDKPVKEQGYYRHPELYGAPEEQNIVHVRYPDLKRAVPPGEIA